MAGLADGLLPYGAPAMDNPFVTPGDQQRERISAAFGWDVGRPWQELGRRALTVLPLMPLGASRSALGASMAGRQPVPSYGLSPNRAVNDPGRFDYEMLRDGRAVGNLRGHVADGQANIMGMYGLGPNAFGPAAMRQLRDAFRRDFPDVNRFAGQRTGGARPFSSRQIVERD